jgi:hypothetical protein
MGSLGKIRYGIPRIPPFMEKNAKEQDSIAIFPILNAQEKILRFI